MRYVVDTNNYVKAISFGNTMEFDDCVCVEYTGMVPYGWSSLEAWYFDEGDKLWRWKIIDGELSRDVSATAPEEGCWATPKMHSKTITDIIYEDTDIAPADGYAGLDRVTIAAQPVYQNMYIYANSLTEMVIGGLHKRPSMILGSITANISTDRIISFEVDTSDSGGSITANIIYSNDPSRVLSLSSGCVVEYDDVKKTLRIDISAYFGESAYSTDGFATRSDGASADYYITILY